MFDETTSWWYLEAVVLSSSDELDENLQQMSNTKDDKQESGVDKPSQKPQTSPEKSTSPWKSGMHRSMKPEEAGPSQLEIDVAPPQLRRATRLRKPNPKYLDGSLA